jgi:hypothetical protein
VFPFTRHFSQSPLRFDNNGELEVIGNFIQLATGTGAAGQTISLSAYPKLDYPAIEVETASGSGEYRPWYVFSDAQQAFGGLTGLNWINRLPCAMTAAQSATVTTPIASPGVVNWTGHGLRPFAAVRFSTTGALPTGITAGQTYFVIPTGFDANSFRIATTPMAAAINFTGTQSGTHTCTSLPDFGANEGGNSCVFNAATRTLTFGNGTVGNVIPSGAKVRMPNIHFTAELLRVPLLTAIASGTAPTFAVTIGKGGGLSVVSGTEFVINNESFTGTITAATHSLSIAQRSLSGSVAASHAQGDTVWMPGINTLSTGGSGRAFSSTPGGKIKLSNCSFGWFYFLISNAQLTNVSRVFTVGGNTINGTTANVTVDRWYNNPSPMTEGSTGPAWGQQFTSIFGDLSVSNLYCGQTNYNAGIVYGQYFDSNTSIVQAENFEYITGGNRSIANTTAISFSTNIHKSYIKNIVAVGGRLRFAAMNSFEVEGIKYSDHTSGITSPTFPSFAIILSNCQKAVIRNVRKTTGGSSSYGGFANTDASCADVTIHDVVFDGQGILGTHAINGLNCKLANATFGATRDVGSTALSDTGFTNSGTGINCVLQNVKSTLPTAYGIENGLGAMSGVFYEYSSGVSLWWRQFNAHHANYKEMGPFHVLLDSGSSTSGTLCCGSFGVEDTRDIYDFTGSAYCDNSGSILLPALNDSVVIKSYQALRTITAFRAVAVAPQEVNAGNMSYEFELEKFGDSFTGSYTALTDTNLQTALVALSGYDSNVGLAIRIRITATVANATNRVLNIRMFTTNDANPVLPVGTTKFLFSGLVANSKVGIYDGSTLLAAKYGVSGSQTLLPPYEYNGIAVAATVKIRSYGYLANEYPQDYNQYDVTKAVAMTTDTAISLSESAALALPVAVNHGAQTITVSGALTAAEVYQALAADICKDANLSRAVHFSSLNGFTTTYTVSGGSNISGVWVDAAGTHLEGTLTNIVNGSRIQIYNVTTATEIVNAVVSGTSYAHKYISGTGISVGNTIRVRLTYVSGLTAKAPYAATLIATSSGFSMLADQETDIVYENYAVDGSTVTECAWDNSNLQIDINDPDNKWYASRMYSYMCYFLTTSAGIATAFDAIRALDSSTLLLSGVYLDNMKALTAKQGDTIRVYRTDDDLPVVNPTSGGGGLTFYATGKIYVPSSGSSMLTETESATLSKINRIAKMMPAVV